MEEKEAKKESFFAIVGICSEPTSSARTIQAKLLPATEIEERLRERVVL
jgi:hypothetical protein